LTDGELHQRQRPKFNGIFLLVLNLQCSTAAEWTLYFLMACCRDKIGFWKLHGLFSPNMPERSIYLCIGGNLGEREDNLEETRMFLNFNFGDVIAVSSVFESEAWGMNDAPAFLNQVVLIKSELSDQELLTEIAELEEFYDRERADDKYLDREMDVDILLIDDAVIQSEGLEVPHPRMALRRFVLEPLCELAPDLMHPVLKKSIKELLDECQDKSLVKKIG
jgi:2-amino-4-hydroxy-6-hydroxymethyldihydropteridine diphosphokinase